MKKDKLTKEKLEDVVVRNICRLGKLKLDTVRDERIAGSVKENILKEIDEEADVIIHLAASYTSAAEFILWNFIFCLGGFLVAYLFR